MNRRGMTLIEVLAATVILSASAAVCASMLRSARASLEVPRASIQQLAALADTFIEDFESFGVAEGELATIGSLSLQWPESIEPDQTPSQPREPARKPVQVSLLESTDQPDNTLPHAWLVFAYEGSTIIRYLALPEDDT